MLQIIPWRRGCRVQAPAKVNLTLRVLGRRPDGYHALESVVVGVGLFDTLDVEPDERLALTVDGHAVPEGDGNLVLTAARTLQEACGTTAGARVHLAKRIPPGRGFGGGSSDAAAALLALDRLWECGLETDALAALGARVGSDVPLFFGSGLAVMRGRGEEIDPVEARCTWHLALAWPEEPLSTAEVYAAYDRLAVEDAPDGPSATAILERLNGPAHAAAPFLVNDLEAAADNVRSSRLDLRACLQEAGADAVAMTGSGSAYFAVADTEGEARQWADAARAAGAGTHVARLLVDANEQQGNTP
jgi:4-diphosphocytidyl-2-C-methyl-D-erythritol kinase